MQKLIVAAAVAAASLTAVALATPAAAETYGTLGYTSLSIDPAKVGAITGRVGWNGGMFGLEGEAGFGVNDDTVGTPPVAVKVNHQFGGYATAKLPLGENFSVMARLGMATQKIEAGGTSDSESSVNYGVAANLMFNEMNGVRVDYTRVDFRDKAIKEGDSWSISFVRKFGM